MEMLRNGEPLTDGTGLIGAEEENGWLDEEKDKEAQKKLDKFARTELNYAVWKVGGVEYRLKLATCYVTALEQHYKKNIMELIGDGMPMLTDMLNVVYYAAKAYPKQNGEITIQKIQSLFDQYIEEGGSQSDFLVDVYMEIFRVSGFLSRKQREQLEKTIAKMKKSL